MNDNRVPRVLYYEDHDDRDGRPLGTFTCAEREYLESLGEHPPLEPSWAEQEDVVMGGASSSASPPRKGDGKGKGKDKASGEGKSAGKDRPAKGKREEKGKRKGKDKGKK